MEGKPSADSPVRVLKKKNGFSRGYWVRVLVAEVSWLGLG